MRNGAKGSVQTRQPELVRRTTRTRGCTLDANATEAKTQQVSRHFRVPAVDRAMNLFELLATSSGGLTLSELSRKLNMPKSATHYLIYTLATRGYLQRASDGRHTLGPHLADIADIANASKTERTLGEWAMPHLRRVSVRFNLTATLTILRGAEALIVGRVISATMKLGELGWAITLTYTARRKEKP